MESTSYEQGTPGFKTLVLMGAQLRLEELQREDTAIRSQFPQLKEFGMNGNGRPAAEPKTPLPKPKRRRRNRRRMSKAARKAVSQRMTRYWAKRRKAKK